MKNTKKLIVIPLVLFFTCCAPTKIWTSYPVSQAIENDYYTAKFEPMKHDKNFFDSFRLEVTNKTNKKMEIDWNKTRYIFNNQPYERFVFQGVTTENINDLPPDIIPAGGILTKDISPLKMVGWKPLKARHVDGPSFTRGPLPEGNNGIYLIIRQNGKEVRQKITLNIEIKIE